MGVRVFLVDDCELVRRGVADLLDHEPDLRVVGGAASVTEALERVPASGADVAVLDVRLAGGDGIELCRELRARLPGLRCLVLTADDDDTTLFNAIMAGAAGVVLKGVHGAELIEAIRTVGAGGSLLDTHLATVFLDRVRSERERTDQLATLSSQERIVFDLIGEGLTNRQIGDQMSLTEKTVKNYVSRVLAKLGLRRRAQVAALVARLRVSGRH